MRISESAVVMQSSFASVRAERTTLEIRRTPPPPREPPPTSETSRSKADLEFSRDFKTYLLKLLVEWLSGEEIDDPELDAESPSEPGADAPARPQVELHYERTRYEAERVDFRAQGVVTTADGRRISLDLQVEMSREHFERVAVDAGGKPLAKDPLVLNFNAATTALGGKKISFDIDLDGTADQVRLPAAGSAFLALDRNHNGRVDDGSELFGATTGNGFAELAELDDDGDGWIDEDDAAFADLRVWSGDSKPLSLKAAGVGAINVSGVATPFTLGRSDAEATGFVRSTGLWLAEDGSPHTVQQIDIVV